LRFALSCKAQGTKRRRFFTFIFFRSLVYMLRSKLMICFLSLSIFRFFFMLGYENVDRSVRALFKCSYKILLHKLNNF
jgi:hypothetical protein